MGTYERAHDQSRVTTYIGGVVWANISPNNQVRGNGNLPCDAGIWTTTHLDGCDLSLILSRWDRDSGSCPPLRSLSPSLCRVANTKQLPAPGGAVVCTLAGRAEAASARPPRRLSSFYTALICIAPTKPKSNFCLPVPLPLSSLSLSLLSITR